MAVLLNKARIRNTRLVAAGAFLIYVFSEPFFPNDTIAYKTIEHSGYLLTVICALGRIYCTAFIGGLKNRKLIEYGPFSVVRNPLYLFSIIGILGVCLITVKLPLIIVPFLMLAIYHLLIQREEAFLEQKFGDEYVVYKNMTPRWIPDFSRYQAPDTVPMSPDNLLKGLGDGIWWFGALPLFQILKNF